MKKMNITVAVTLTIMMAGMFLPGVTAASDLPGTGATAQQLNLQKAKTILLDTLDRLQTHFETTQAKAAKLQKLTETSGIDIGQVISGYITQVQDFKTKAADAKTGAELKAVAQAVHNLIINAKTDVQKTISRRVEIGIDKFTQKADLTKPLIDLAQRRVTQLQNRGADTQTVNKDLQSCKQLMNQGSENLQDAKNKLRQFQQLPREQENQDGQLMKDGLKLVQNARTTYSQAHQDCVKAMKELKATR